MPAIDKIPEPFQRYCRQWSRDFRQLSSSEDRIEYTRKALPELLLDRSAWSSILGNITEGRPYPDIRGAAFFENEVLLYLDEARLFSIRIYFFEPGEYTMIHDHSAWGISGTPAGRLGVVKYRREDDGSEDDRVRLKEREHLTLAPGEVEMTPPLDSGIHRTGNPLSEGTILMVSVYGKPMRRLYIQQYHPETHRVTRVYPPKLKKKRLAGRALNLMENPG